MDSPDALVKLAAATNRAHTCHALLAHVRVVLDGVHIDGQDSLGELAAAEDGEKVVLRLGQHVEAGAQQHAPCLQLLHVC